MVWTKVRDSRESSYENKYMQAPKNEPKVDLRTREVTAYDKRRFKVYEYENMSRGLGGLVVGDKYTPKQSRLEMMLLQSSYKSPWKVIEKANREWVRNYSSAAPKTALEEQVRVTLQDHSRGRYFKLMEIISDKDFLVKAYNEIRSNPGNMTRGPDNETLDKISETYFENLSQELLTGKFRFRPGRVVLIPKKNGKFRPLTIVPPRDKIVQKAITIVLQAIWEPSFHESSHGFRPNRSTHSALKPIYLRGDNYNWVIQGDITKCFDNIPHDTIRKSVKSKIGDVAVQQLIDKWLKAGQIINQRLIKNKNIGVPQGGVLSPLISNIVLHNLDKYMEKCIESFEIGKLRKRNTVYRNLIYKRRVERSRVKKLELTKLIRLTPSVISMDPGYKRMMYIRYADDFVVLMSASKNEAMRVKSNIKDILKNKCGSELNEEKTIITNLKHGFEFLGALIKKPSANNFMVMRSNKKIRVQTRMLMLAPIDKLIDKLIQTQFAYRNSEGKPIPQAYNALINQDHYTIISFYNSKMNGILNYYTFATNLNRLRYITWILQASCAMTLGAKYKCSMKEMFKRFGKTLEDPATGKLLQLPENYRTTHKFSNSNTTTDPMKNLEITWSGKLTLSTFDRTCVICGTNSDIEMHHLRKVGDVRYKIRKNESTYAEWIGAAKRKQIPLCQYHHQILHKGGLSYHELMLIVNYQQNLPHNE